MAKTVLTKDQYDHLDELMVAHGGNLRPDYSGRGMYGATCLGWDDKDREGPGAFQMALAEVLAPDLLYLDEDEQPDLNDVKEAMDQLGSPSSDGMGLGTIYYYRNIQVDGHAQKARY